MAYLEGLAEIYKDETRANKLSELAAPPCVYKERARDPKKLAQDAAENTKKTEDWNDFKKMQLKK